MYFKHIRLVIVHFCLYIFPGLAQTSGPLPLHVIIPSIVVVILVVAGISVLCFYLGKRHKAKKPVSTEESKGDTKRDSMRNTGKENAEEYEVIEEGNFRHVYENDAAVDTRAYETLDMQDLKPTTSKEYASLKPQP